MSSGNYQGQDRSDNSGTNQTNTGQARYQSDKNGIDTPENAKLVKEWISGNQVLPFEAVLGAEALGKFISPTDAGGDAMTTSQLRRFFGSLKVLQIQARVAKKEADFDLLSVKLLKPQLAYAKGKTTTKKNQENNRISNFYTEVSVGIDAVSNRQQFLKLAKWLEVIVAYHKFYGGDKIKE